MPGTLFRAARPRAHTRSDPRPRATTASTAGASRARSKRDRSATAGSSPAATSRSTRRRSARPLRSVPRRRDRDDSRALFGGPCWPRWLMLAGYVGLEKFKGRDSALGALARRDREARLPRTATATSAIRSFPGVRQDALHRPGAAQADRRDHRPAARDAERRASAVPEEEQPSTTHFSVVDAAGGAVSVTTTLNDSFGNARVAPGLGFLWNNEMDDFATSARKAQHRTGSIQGEVNAVAPGKADAFGDVPVDRGRSGTATRSSGARRAARRSRRRTSRCCSDSFCAARPSRTRSPRPASTSRTFPTRSRSSADRFDPAWIDGPPRSIGHTVVEREPKDDPIGRVHAIARRADGTADRRRRPAQRRRRPRRSGDSVTPAGPVQVPRAGRRVDVGSPRLPAALPRGRRRSASRPATPPGERGLADAGDVRPRSRSRSARWRCAAPRRSASPRRTARRSR